MYELMKHSLRNLGAYEAFILVHILEVRNPDFKSIG